MELSKRDATLLKGFSIIIIVMHNVLRHVQPVLDGEFKLKSGGVLILFSSIYHDPIGIINYLISYAGWYFIIFFIFITAYGCSKKLIKLTSYIELIIHQYAKTIPLLIIGGVVLFFLKEYSAREIANAILFKIIGLDNLTFSSVYDVVGVWWYFGLFFQLCLLVPFIYKLQQKINSTILFVFSYVIIYAVYFGSEKISIFATAIGHIPEIIMAIKWSIDGFKPRVLFFAFFCFIFVLSIFIPYAFPFTYVSFLYISLTVFLFSKKLMSNFKGIIEFLLFAGKISPYMFVVNGIISGLVIEKIQLITMKMPPFLLQVNSLRVLVGTLMHVVGVIAISTMLYALFNNLIFEFSKKTIKILQ